MAAGGVENRGTARSRAPSCRELSGSVSVSFRSFQSRSLEPSERLFLDVPFFFRGRRMWPLARKSADPGEACGSVLNRCLGSKTLVAI